MEQACDVADELAAVRRGGERTDVAARAEVGAFTDEQNGADPGAGGSQGLDPLGHARGGEGGATLGGRHGDAQHAVLDTDVGQY